jgi:hypothetical protein
MPNLAALYGGTMSISIKVTGVNSLNFDKKITFKNLCRSAFCKGEKGFAMLLWCKTAVPYNNYNFLTYREKSIILSSLINGARFSAENAFNQ